MILYNDCEYLAHHLLTLGYMFQQCLPAPLNVVATFVDMVPSFQALGRKYFRNQMVSFFYIHVITSLHLFISPLSFYNRDFW
jgi:hypothetical protein